MHTQQTIEAVFRALLDPNADLIDAAGELGIPLTEFLAIAESPQITAAIEALERLARIRERALLARASHTAIAALERIADSDPETPSARETARKAAAQLLRMAAKAEAASNIETSTPLPTAHSPLPAPAESARPGEVIPSAATSADSPRPTPAEPSAPSHPGDPAESVLGESASGPPMRAERKPAA